MKIQKILVPVDGSVHSERAVHYAVDMAKLVAAEIVLLHCHRPFPTVLGEPYLQKVISAVLEQAQELMEPYRSILKKAEIRFSDRILEGPAGAQVVSVAKIEACDLIIMGTKGKNDLEGLVLGSVTHRVLNAAPCPVLVVR